MGHSDSWSELGSKLAHLDRELESVPKAGVNAAALTVKKSVLGIAPARLRNVGKKGAKLGVRYDIKSFPSNAVARVYATGPWSIIERNTKAHRIPRQRRKPRPIKIPGIGWRMYAMHPGTKGKHPWRKGVEAAQPLVKREFHTGVATAMRKVF